MAAAFLGVKKNAAKLSRGERDGLGRFGQKLWLGGQVVTGR
jgi:hypothetical protein